VRSPSRASKEGCGRLFPHVLTSLRIAERGIGLDRCQVRHLSSREIEHYWVMARDSITNFRREQKDDTFYYHFRKLYHSTKALGRKKGAPDHEKTRGDVESFIDLELRKIEFFLNADDRELWRKPVPPHRKLSTARNVPSARC
jgi:hypothetical protein